ncbi:hypothetical protein DNTS_017885, partial [Danionella cerebrum]
RSPQSTRSCSNGVQQKMSDPQLFDAEFEKLVSELTEQDFTDPVLADALTRLQEVLNYNAPGGKRNRGLSVIGSLRELISPSEVGPDEVHRALLVGWCIELLQAFFLVADDIMDASVTRRGQPCWYKKHGIGLDAINDAFLLEGSIYRLLRRHCRGQPYYVHLLELFTETSFQTELGQALDLMTAPPHKIDLNRFTMERYKAIVKYKTAFYSFYLPVAAAMYMAGIENETEHQNAKTILLEMGEFFQIQTCYGRSDAESVERVKALYDTLEMPIRYHQHEEESYRRLQKLIQLHAKNLPHAVFLNFAKKIYKRNK